MKPTTLMLLAALAAAPCLYAQAPPAPSPEVQAARDAMRKACADDMKNLCGDKQGREAFACMRQNNDKLSQGCKDAMAKLPRPSGPPPSPPPAQ